MKFKAFVTILTLMVVFLPLQSSQALIDPQDIVQVKIPPANSTVRNTTEVRFRVYDDDTSSIPIRLEILDSSCVNKLRTIVNSNYPSSQGDQVRGWNTAGAYSDGNALSDGNYCLSLCANMKNNTQAYGVCRRQGITIRNRANNPPVITSRPATSVSYGGTYSYSVQVSDADGDKLTYSIKQKPAFLNFSGNRLSGSNIRQSGKHKIVIEVTDGFGGLARQTYNLTVASAPQTPPTTPPTTPPVEEPDEPDTGEEEPVSVEFVYPKAESVLEGENNLIEWAIENVDKEDIEGISLQYSPADSNSWKRVTDELEPGDDSFAWDVSEITNGEYKLRIIVEINGEDDLIVDSSNFNINNQDQEPSEEDEPIIVSDLTPENGAAVEEIPDGKIKALITVSKDVNDGNLDISKLKVTLNETDITGDCSLEDADETDTTKSYNLSCEVDQPEPGEYRIKIEIPEQEYDRQSSFTVVEPGEAPAEDRNLQEILPIILISAVVLCLLLLPLILLTIVRRRRSYYFEETETTTKEDDTDSVTEHALTTSETTPLIGDAFDTNASVSTNYFPEKDTAETGEVTTTTTTVEKKSIKSRLSNLGDKIKNAIPARKPKEDVADLPAPKEDKSLKVEKVESTASILEGGANNYSLSDNYAADNPAAPVAPAKKTEVVQPPAAVATATATADTQTQPKAVAQAPKQDKVADVGDQDLPDWLKDTDGNSSTLPGKDDALEQKQNAKDKKTDNGLNDDDDDGSDPYGFGEYSLGNPN